MMDKSKTVITKCYSVYILSDSTKFDHIATATFSDFTRPILITDHVDEKYRSLIKTVEAKY